MDRPPDLTRPPQAKSSPVALASGGGSAGPGGQGGRRSLNCSAGEGGQILTAPSFKGEEGTSGTTQRVVSLHTQADGPAAGDGGGAQPQSRVCSRTDEHQAQLPGQLPFTARVGQGRGERGRVTFLPVSAEGKGMMWPTGNNVMIILKIVSLFFGCLGS